MKRRLEKYSPLKEVVEATPGYHYDRIGGPVYSDRYGLKDLKRIRNRIRSDFYTPSQLLHIARKAHRLRLANAADIATGLLKSPIVFYRLLRSNAERRKDRRGRHPPIPIAQPKAEPAELAANKR